MDQLKEQLQKQLRQDLIDITSINVLKDLNEQYSTLLLATQEQLRDLSASKEENIPSLYIELKDRYNELQKSHTKLSEDYKQLKENVDKQIQDLKDTHLNELIDLNTKYLEEQINNQENSSKLKQNVDGIEANHFKEIQKLNENAANKYNQMESHLQKLLDYANSKLRDANKSNNVLRAELMSCKNQYNFNVDTSQQANSERIRYLEDTLFNMENQLRIAQSNRQPNFSCQIVDYNNFEASNENKLDNVEETMTVKDVYSNANKPKKFWPLKKYIREKNAGTSNQPASNFSKPSTSSNQAQNRKRKLYDNMNLDYMENLENSD